MREYYKELYSQMEDLRSQNEGLLEVNKQLREMYNNAITANLNLKDTIDILEDELKYLRLIEKNF